MTNPSYPDLDYEEGSFVGPLSMRRVREWESYLHRVGYTSIKFDDSFIKYLSRFHGGRPGKCVFTNSEGEDDVIIWFGHFNDQFVDEAPLDDLPNKYRLSKDDPRRVYAIPRMHSDAYDRLGMFLMPFADCAFGDMVCFDHSAPGRPKVVHWLHEQCMEGEPPHTVFIADNFDEFLTMLRPRSDD